MAASATIYGNEIAAEVGSVVKPDGWRFAQRLNPSTWEAAEFYLTTGHLASVKELAVNVTVTGRTFQRREGEYWVRVRIEFVGDGEASAWHGGWMLKR